MRGSSQRHATTRPDAWRTLVAGLTTAVAMLVIVNAGRTFADGLAAEAAAEGTPALKLKASVIGASAPTAPLTIELFRWSTDVERAPLLAALAAPPPVPPGAAPAAPAGRAGRAARGGRAAAPPLSPIERLTNAIKAAPTVGFIWGDGPTGYSIKYAWRASSPNTAERVVLVTDRRLGANVTSWPAPVASSVGAEFTVVEMRIDGKGVGEAKSSLTSPLVVDATANTIAIDKYADAPVLLKVTR
ncbi:MAG TPA: hypothetical protein VKA59_11045 [Vicinamibacterales bacterium]|nr:hypothetical protein [Vicinamibacterales bacterium]